MNAILENPLKLNVKWQDSALFDSKKFKPLIHMRDELYPILGERCDAAMDLIDALAACKTNAQCVTELSECPEFRREYSSITDAIHYLEKQEKDIIDTFIQQKGISSLATLSIDDEPYNLIACDSTPAPHAYAECLEDKTIIHDAKNKVTGRPINIGHEYSAVVGVTPNPAWVSPLAFERIPSTESPAPFGVRQVAGICKDLPNKAIALFDSHYNTKNCIQEFIKMNQIVIVRSACNRKYYIPAEKPPPNKKGRPAEYGPVVNLYDPPEGAAPNLSMKIDPPDGKGYLLVSCWQKVYTKMKGTKGYQYPSAVLSITEFREDHTPKYNRPMVLRIFVPEEMNFNIGHAAWLYANRFTIERFFSSEKKHLLFGKFQSPEVEYQEVFVQISTIAYQQLFFAKMSGELSWRIKPWHRYPKHKPKGLKLIPSHVQKGYSAVLREIGTPSKYRPSNHKPHGRRMGETQPKRKKHPVIRKSPAKKPIKPTSDSPCMEPNTKKEALKVVAKVIGESLLSLILFFAIGIAAIHTKEVAAYELSNSLLLFQPFEMRGRNSNSGLITNDIRFKITSNSISVPFLDTG